MIVPGSANALLLASAAPTGYNVERSLRFSSSDSAYLSRTPASAGNRKTWTWAGWVKRSGLGSRQLVFGNLSPNGGLGFDAEFTANDSLDIYDYSSAYEARKNTTQVFRDCSAWYHIVITYDSQNTTAADRLRLYVNNTRVTTFANSTDPTLNADGRFNTAVETSIGRSGAYAQLYFNGYLADIHFIDGQALDPTSFTETDATTGQLIPKAYAGSYGTNGFHLPFSDNSTAAALGTDTSGNGNTWTVNNISVAAGAGNDSLVDTPSSYGTDDGLGGSVRGNYCTANPLDNFATLSNGNLQVASPSASYVNARGTIAFPSTGKWYAEATITSNTGASSVVTFGLATKSASLSSGYGNASNMYVFLVGSTLICYNSTTVVFDVAGTLSAGDVMQIAYDADTGKVWVGANNTWRNSTGGTTGNPGAGTNQTFTLSAGEYFPFAGGYSNTLNVNWGQRSWAYAAPSGFKALCDTNLPTPVVAKPSTVMDVKLYTGNGSTQTISGLGFSPDLVWIKVRNTTYWHELTDSVRGTGKTLFSNATDSETTTNTLTAFNTDGFTVAVQSGYNGTNESTRPYVAWTWDAGSSTVTNTQGSITSQVRANPSAGFSIVTFTKTATTSETIGHGLGVAPSMVIVKTRGSGGYTSWAVWHVSIGIGNYLELNTTTASQASSTIWNNTPPTSTVFSMGTAWTATQNMVAYCFAPVDGYSSFGSYAASGSSDGPFQWCGFRPRWVMLKRSDSTESWIIIDAARDTYNLSGNNLFPNSSGAEVPPNASLDILSNGFKLRSTVGGGNVSGGTYVWAAFAESPFQYARAR